MVSLDWPKTDRWIMGESWVGSRLGEYLVELTDGIGPRWAGTDGDARAARYIRGVMESLGLDARLEEFELDTWQAGTCAATIVSHTASSGSRGVTILPMLNCPPLDLTAPLVDVGFGMPHELHPGRERLRGAVAVMNVGLEPFSAPRTMADRILDLAAAGCAAVIAVDGRSGGRIEYVHATDKRRAERAGEVLPHPVPTVQTHKEGGIAFRRAAAAGHRVRIHVESRSFRTACHNTVADLGGSRWPDETLIVSAHHDTYPNSPGAVDNGSGCVVVMDVARTLGALEREFGVTPGRTIRFCTFSGEEQNFQGSAAYVRTHYGPEPAPRFVINLDEVAAGPIKGLALQFPHQRQLMQGVLDELGEGLRAHVMSMLDHSNDGFSFARRAIPYAILWRWRFVGRHPDADYRAELWDTADKVRIRELKEYSAYLARIVLRLSHVPPESWPANPVTVAQVEAQMRQETGQVLRVM